MDHRIGMAKRSTSGAEKVSLTLARDVLDEARARSGGNLSAYVNEALGQRVRRETLRELLDELDVAHGPVPAEVREEMERRWPRPAPE